ncbi:MAG: GatB/YqeY domain-containing protein [Gaiellales bacterium]
MIEQVEADLREARLARDADKVGALSMLLAALKDAEKANGGTHDDAGAIQVMTRERKKRVEAAESFREGGREDAAIKEETELALIDRYLPAQLSAEELSELIAATIAEAGATEPKDLGSVMKILQPKTAGRADGKAVSTAVREALGA